MSPLHLKNFIEGQFVEPSKKEYLDNYCPATGAVYSYIPASGKEDVEQAVSAARRAFGSWSQTKAERRAAIMTRIADLILAKQEALSEAESVDQGKPKSLAHSLDVPRAAQNFRFFAGQILYQQSEAYDMDGQAMNFTLRKPVGVAGLISPWNLPLYLLTWKIAPAIAVGNTVVCKPSELTSMTAYLLAKIFVEAGLPPGVVNIIFGLGSQAGESLVRHPQVPLLSFTGGTATGKKLFEASSAHIKKISLELGGKNANLIFADCKLEKAIQTSLRSSFLNQGEICLCGSRIFVEESLYLEFVEKFVAQTKKLVVGDPLDSKTFMGALVSREHLEKVRGFVALAQQEGGTIETGFEPLHLPDHLSQGYFMRPTVITGLQPHSRVMQEEIFGPVVTITPFKNEVQVLAMANEIEYGLSATLWTQDISRAHRIARALDVGTLWVNTWMLRDLRVPFGGMKKSGIGREGGLHSLDFFTESTNVCINTSPDLDGL